MNTDTDDLRNAATRNAAAVRTARALHAPMLDVLDATRAELSKANRWRDPRLHPAAAAAYITAGKSFDAASAALDAARAAYEDACLDLVEAGKAFDETSGGYSQGVRQ